MAVRFVDHVEAAEVEGDLAAAWRRGAGPPHRALLPYRRAAGPAAYRAVQVAFADTDIDAYATGESSAPERRPGAVRRLDPIWNRQRAVYQSRQALYVPAGSAQTFRVMVPADGTIETALGLVSPAGTPARFRVAVDGETLLDRPLEIAGRWVPVKVQLPRRGGDHVATVRFTLDAVAVGVAVGGDGPPPEGFFADPIAWSHGGGAAGRGVVFILLDTLRFDALAVMPHLRGLMAQSAVFDQAITAATWTRPSMLAMYGGDLPTAVGQSAQEMIPTEAERQRFYRLDPPLLPRLLAARGYRVSAIGNNFFLLGYPAIGLDLGFEEVDDIRHPVKDTPAITRAATRYLEENRTRAFFLHVHYDAAHWPYTPPEKYLARRPADAPRTDGALDRDPLWRRYLGEAAYVDDNLGQLLEAIDRLGLARSTMVVVVSDHGEVFDPRHDHFVEALGQRTLHHHGWAGYDELLRVPLAIRLPEKIAPVKIGAQVRTYDLAPTIADFLDLRPAGPTGHGRGRSLRPLIEHGTEGEERVAFTEGQHVRVVRSGGLALLRRDDPRIRVRGETVLLPEELYDVRRDPLEHENRAGADPDALARMRALFAREAPVAPEGPTTVYHLRAAPDERPHVIEAKLSSGRVAVRGVSGAGAEVLPDGPHQLAVRLRDGGGIDFTLEPPDSPLKMALVRDGEPFALRRLLVGEYALPLLDGDPAEPIDQEHLRRLDAARPPLLGRQGHLLLWRDPGAPEVAAAESADSGSNEVTAMMQRWGYARPDGRESRPEGAAARRGGPRAVDPGRASNAASTETPSLR